MVDNIKIVSAQTIENALKYGELIPAIEQGLAMFSSRPESGLVQPVRTFLNVSAGNATGFFGVMPAYSQTNGILCTKMVSFFPQNTNVATHHALIAMFDCHTGAPTAILDGEVITGHRTAAASAVATKYLASGTPQHLAILGAGVQARSHFHALSHLYQFKKVTIWNHRPAKAEALAAELGDHVVAVESVEEAVRDADIIVTVTNSSTPVLMAHWVKSGAHINAVGSCRPDWNELDPKLMQEAAVYVDSRESAAKESGDVIKSGATIAGEIGELVLGKVQARKTETTVFKSLGLAIEDAMAADLVMKVLEASEKTDTTQ